jgi:hypothetical protein
MARLEIFLPGPDLPALFAHETIRHFPTSDLRLRTAEPAKRSRPVFFKLTLLEKVVKFCYLQPAKTLSLFISTSGVRKV